MVTPKRNVDVHGVELLNSDGTFDTFAGVVTSTYEYWTTMSGSVAVTTKAAIPDGAVLVTGGVIRNVMTGATLSTCQSYVNGVWSMVPSPSAARACSEWAPCDRPGCTRRHRRHAKQAWSPSTPTAPDVLEDYNPPLST